MNNVLYSLLDENDTTWYSSFWLQNDKISMYPYCTVRKSAPGIINQTKKIETRNKILINKQGCSYFQII